ncbi:MAG TPA: farnesyl diphosphate synthase [Thermodesulfobacteriota bacterium]|nr:farnesyl diphosphate synthase [Thermodesulfobacteriota bacterium]
MGEFNLDKYFAEKAEFVNSALGRLLAGEDEYPQGLHSAMHYSLFAGGKRIRPVLTLAAAEAVGGDIEGALNTASAIECIHTYSLIHDDLPAIDDDDFRRGRPTCHKVYGEAMAILAGDALLTSAFEMIGKTPGVAAERLLMVILDVARAAGSMGMIGGQVVDIESEGKEVDFPVLEYIHIHKTGGLILASVRCGAILGGADEKELEALTGYGGSVGLAFQILDDILDVEGSSTEMGKATGSDVKLGKATYPAVLGLEESRRRARELVTRALDSISAFDDRAEPLRALAGYIISRKK